MNKNNITFDNKKIKKATFTIKIKKYLIQMTLMLTKYQSLKKNNNSFIYFIVYNDNDVIRPLCLRLSKMTGYINKFYENKITMLLVVKDKQLLKN